MDQLPNYEIARNFEFAGSLQAILNGNQSRIYELDIQQRESLVGIGVAIASGDNCGYVEMATGTGKATAAALLAEAAVNAGQRVLMLAPTVTAADTLSGLDTAGSKGLSKFTDLHHRKAVRHHYAGRKGSRISPVVVSTYGGFLNDYQNHHAQLGQFDVVIADECHRSLGPKTSVALRSAFPGAIKIGLSATPDYATDRASEEVFEKRLYEFSLAHAIEMGKTAPVRALLISTDSMLNLTDHGRDFTSKEQAPLAADMARNGLVAQLARDFVADGRKGIIACVPGEGNLHARIVADLLSKPEFGNIRAAAVGGHLDKDTVRKLLTQFENGELDVLTSTKAILESWDSNQASFCINAAPTTSEVKLKQLLGRIIRKKPDGQEAIFVDMIDQQSGISKYQYTALHALELDTVDYDRVLGAEQDQNKFTARIGELPTFGQDILQKLQNVQGKTLADVFKTVVNKDLDPLVIHWEAVLAAEGLPAELSDNSVIPAKFMKSYKNVAAQLFKDSGVTPTNEEIIDRLTFKTGFTKDVINALGEFGIQIALTDMLIAEDYLAPTEDEPFETVVEGLLKEQLYACLDTLGPKKIMALTTKYGLSQDENEAFVHNYQTSKDLQTIGSSGSPDLQYITGTVTKNNTEVGREISMSGGSVSHQVNTGLSNLRHPSRSYVLRSYLNEGVDVVPYQHYAKTAVEEYSPKTAFEHQANNMTNRFISSVTNRYTKGIDESVLNVLVEKLHQPDAVAANIREFARLFGIAEKSAYGTTAQFSRAEQLIQYLAYTARVKYNRISNRPLHESSQEQRNASLALIEPQLKLFEAGIIGIRNLREKWISVYGIEEPHQMFN